MPAALVAVPVAELSHMRFVSATAASAPMPSTTPSPNTASTASSVAANSAALASIPANTSAADVRTALAAVHTLRIYTGYGSRHGAVLRAGGGGALDHASALRAALLSELQRTGGADDDDVMNIRAGGIGGGSSTGKSARRGNSTDSAAGFLGAEFARARVTIELVPHNAGAFDIGLASLCASAGAREPTSRHPRHL